MPQINTFSVTDFLFKMTLTLSVKNIINLLKIVMFELMFFSRCFFIIIFIRFYAVSDKTL